MPSGTPLLKQLFVCSLLNFTLCSISFGTLRAAADPDKVFLECGPLVNVTFATILVRLTYAPIIVLACACFKPISRFALMIDAFFTTVFLCTELITSAIHLTRFRCYESLKTDPVHGFAVFVYAMSVLITIDAMLLAYFVFSRERARPKPTTVDDEIELLLQELEETDEPTPRKSPAKPIACAPGP